MHVDTESAYSAWKPFETYQVPREGGTAYPSYDPGARISFKENSFRETCTVSLRVSVASFSLLFTINNLHIAQVNDFKKTLKIPKMSSESANRRRRENTMAKRTNNDLQSTTQRTKDQ
jgi:hypothetical protein